MGWGWTEGRCSGLNRVLSKLLPPPGPVQVASHSIGVCAGVISGDEDILHVDPGATGWGSARQGTRRHPNGKSEAEVGGEGCSHQPRSARSRQKLEEAGRVLPGASVPAAQGHSHRHDQQELSAPHPGPERPHTLLACAGVGDTSAVGGGGSTASLLSQFQRTGRQPDPGQGLSTLPVQCGEGSPAPRCLCKNLDYTAAGAPRPAIPTRANVPPGPGLSPGAQTGCMVRH